MGEIFLGKARAHVRRSPDHVFLSKHPRPSCAFVRSQLSGAALIPPKRLFWKKPMAKVKHKESSLFFSSYAATQMVCLNREVSQFSAALRLEK